MVRLTGATRLPLDGTPQCTVRSVVGDERLPVGTQDATHVGAVGRGRFALSVPDGRRYEVGPGMWFVAPGRAHLAPVGVDDDEPAAVVVTVDGWRGLFALGGPVEDRGRLTYIDGCTDTVLAPPPRRGDPCLNLLVVPPHTDQTTHHHPSLRAGIVVAGTGRCEHAGGPLALEPGVVWCIPAGVEHAFHTGADSLAVVAFHPDSDTGPTDDDHPMRNRTLIG